jgi:hypothetical protein
MQRIECEKLLDTYVYSEKKNVLDEAKQLNCFVTQFNRLFRASKVPTMRARQQYHPSSSSSDDDDDAWTDDEVLSVAY